MPGSARVCQGQLGCAARTAPAMYARIICSQLKGPCTWADPDPSDADHQLDDSAYSARSPGGGGQRRGGQGSGERCTEAGVGVEVQRAQQLGFGEIGRRNQALGR